MTQKGEIGISVGVMIINDDDQILLGERIYNGNICWNMPGGKMDFGESLVDAAKRETKEECNLDMEKLQQISVSEHYNIDKKVQFVMIGYKTRDYSGILNNNEPHVFEKWQWFDLDNLPNSIFEPSQCILNQSNLT